MPAVTIVAPVLSLRRRRHRRRTAILLPVAVLAAASVAFAVSAGSSVAGAAAQGSPDSAVGVVSAVEVSAVEVSAVTLTPGPFAAVLGLAHERQLDFVVTNTGAVAVSELQVTLRGGTGANQSRLLEFADLGTIKPGEGKAYRVAVMVDALSWGTFTVRGSIAELATPVEFGASGPAHPWLGLGIVAGLLAALVALTIASVARALRSRRARGNAAPVIDLRDHAAIDLGELVAAWAPLAPPRPDDIEAAMAEVLRDDLPAWLGVDPSDPDQAELLGRYAERIARATVGRDCRPDDIPSLLAPPASPPAPPAATTSARPPSLR